MNLYVRAQVFCGEKHNRMKQQRGVLVDEVETNVDAAFCQIE